MRTTMLLLAGLALFAWSGCTGEKERAEPGDGDVQPNTNAEDNDNGAAENDNGTAEENDNAGGGGGTEPEQGVAELDHFASADEFEDYFKEQILLHNDRFTSFLDGRPSVGVDEDVESVDAGDNMDPEAGGGAAEEGDQAAPPAASNGDGEYSETTIQEEGVDEADVVKTDGTYLYIVNNDWGGGQSQLDIVKAVPANELQLLSTFTLEGWDCQLYLAGDRVVAVTSSMQDAVYSSDDVLVFFIDYFLNSLSGAEGGEGDVDPVEEFLGLLEGSVPTYETIVTVIDVSDPANPTQVAQTVFEGSVVSSRMIDGVLRLVTAIYPEQYGGILPLGLPEVDTLFEFVGLDDLLPKYELVDASHEVTVGNVVGWEDFYRPADPDGFGITTIITLDTAAPEAFDAVAVAAQPGLVYASTEALYLTDTDWYYDFRREDTDIYKFAFEEGTVRLAGAATVPGRVLNQYSMGEYEGYLRVATTTDDLWDWETGEQTPSSNGVYVLGESEGALAIVGSIEDLAIGEQVQSARFIGSRGFVVTFEQMDPLFTLDLTDPTNPQVVGELKVPGYSTFIVPMDDDHLLTVGVYVDPEEGGWSEGVQLSVFDVSNFADPQTSDTTVIGDSNTYSEATWNPKAFTYFAAQGLLALPIEHYAWYGTDGWEEVDDSGAAEGGGSAGEDGTSDGEPAEPAPNEMRQTETPLPEEIGDFRGLFVYRVTPEEGFDYLGRVSTDMDDEDNWYSWSAFTRGVFIGDQVYAVTELAVVAAPVADVGMVTASLSLPEPAYVDEPVIYEDPFVNGSAVIMPDVPTQADGGGASGAEDGGGASPD